MAHSRHSVLPVPVGDSSNACWPCGHNKKLLYKPAGLWESSTHGGGTQQHASPLALKGSVQQRLWHSDIGRQQVGARLLQRGDHLGHVGQLAGVGVIGELHLNAAAGEWERNKAAGGDERTSGAPPRGSSDGTCC